MNEQFIQNAVNRGGAGIWLSSIPALVKEFEHRWRIRVGAPFDLSWNYVAPATLADGSQAVLKVVFPADQEFQTELDTLKLYQGDGMVKLLEADQSKAVMLLERLQPGLPVVALADDETATRVLASVMKRLRKPAPEHHSFPHISDWAKGIESYKDAVKGANGPLPAYLIDRADDLFRELIESITEPILAHGDLHHENVLSAQREPWLAIDPKGVVAETAYEAAAMLRNPQPNLMKKTNLAEVLTRRIVILSEELEIEPARIQKWGIAQTVLSAAWSFEGAGTIAKNEITIAEILTNSRI